MPSAVRVCARKAGIAEAMKFSFSPRPMISGHSFRAATRVSWLLAVHGDERVVPAQLAEGPPHGLGQVPVVVALDQVG